jgi:hypothetical protein
MARINDLEKGFEKTLAYAYGTHVVQGHLIMHNIDIIGTDKQVTLLMALGDGAYTAAGDGSWGLCTVNELAEGCDENDKILATYSSHVNLDLLEDGSLEKSGGSAFTYDANAYSEPTFDGDHCFYIEWEATEQKHTQLISILIEDTLATPSSRNGWQMNEAFGSTPVLNTIVANSFGGDVSYTFPAKFTITGDGAGNGQLQVNGGLGTGFSYDTSKTYRVRVAVGGLDGIPVAVAPPVFVSAGFGVTGTTSVCPSVKGVYYGGRLISPDSWHYHPGTFSTGADDPVQGIDSFFPGGITYSATAYIAIRLPVGVAEDADPSKVAVILETSCIGDYDINGNLTEISYSANPARVKADMLKRRGQLSRINWDSYVQARDWYNGLLAWESGDTVNTYTDINQAPTYTLSGNIQGSSGGALSKVSASTGYDNSAVTIERIASGQDGEFSITVNSAFPTFIGGGAAYLVDKNGKVWFGIAWGNGHVAFLANGVAIDDATTPYDYPASAPVTFTLKSNGGNFIFEQDGVEKTPPQGSSLVPLDTDLFGKVLLYQNTATISASNIVGQIVNTTSLTTTEVPRFEAHPAFTSAVGLTDALDFVDSLCASETQDAGKEIIFITPATPSPRVSAFTFTEGKNVIDGTLRVYKRDVRERPNRLSGVFRNLDTVYLEEDEVFETRDALFDQVGYIVDPGALNFASMHTSQAQRLIKYQMRRLSDDSLFCDLNGMQDSVKLLPGDIVTVISEKLSGGITNPTEFIIIQASRDSGESTAYTRSFVLQEYHATDYSDTDHGPRQVTVTDPIPSPFEGPDAPVLTLTQSTSDAGGIVTNKILGTIHFATYLYNQTAKIYVTFPLPDGSAGTEEIPTGIEVSPISGKSEGSFDFVAPLLGVYKFRAEAISYTGVVGGSGIALITIGEYLIDDDEELLVEDGELLTEG